MYLRNSKIVFIVYDVCNYNSVEEIRDHWLDFVYKNTNTIYDSENNDDYLVLLIGNKCEMSDPSKNRNIIEAKRLMKDKLNIKHLLVSAKTGYDIETLLGYIKDFANKSILYDETLDHSHDEYEPKNVIKITKDYWESLKEDDSILQNCFGSRCSLL